MSREQILLRIAALRAENALNWTTLETVCVPQYQSIVKDPRVATFDNALATDEDSAKRIIACIASVDAEIASLSMRLVGGR